jgi:hypothetical protein
MKQKRNRRTRHKLVKTHSARTPSRRFREPQSAEEFFGLSEAMQDRWLRLAEGVTKVRTTKKTINKVSKELGLDRRFVLSHGRSAFRKLKNGRYAAKGYDRLLRVIRVVMGGGLQEVATRDSREASKGSRHSAAVDHYLETGNSSRLREFDGQAIVDLNGKRFPLLTDLEEIDRLGSAGEFSFETLYVRSA